MTRTTVTRSIAAPPADVFRAVTDLRKMPEVFPVADQRVRMVADSHGTVWDTVMTVRPGNGGCELAITMDARAQSLLPKLMNPLMKGLFRKGLVDHAEAVATWCERG